MSRPVPQLGRTQSIVGLIPPDARVADVGSGDGGLPRALLAARRARWCVATERTAETGARLAALGPQDGLEVRFGDGLAPLLPADRIDVVVLAGMGTRTVLTLLADEARRDRRLGWRRLVVQPQTEPGRLRRELVRQGLTIVDEAIAFRRGQYYVTLALEARPGSPIPHHPRLTREALFEAGPCLVSSGSPWVARLWCRELDRLESIVARATPGPGRLRAEARRDLALRVLAEVEHLRSRRV